MTKTQSGALLIAIGFAVNAVGRLLMDATRGSDNPAVAGFIAPWMLASVVVALFGFFRLVSGLLGKKP